MNPELQRGLWYLATPYSKYPTGIEQAFKDAAALTGRLLVEGVRAYSPIAHTHPVAIYAGLNPLDHNIWLPFDEAMMAVADGIIVAKMPGWHHSFGINYEVDVFERAGKPVRYLDPESLRVNEVLRGEG